MAIALAFITGVLSIIFAASMMDHYLVKRRQYHLIWAIGFGLLFLGMLFWVLREGLGQSELLYSLWFVTGGVLVPAYFGSGMISMMFPQLIQGTKTLTIGGTERVIKKGDAFLGTLVGVSVIFLILALVAPIRTPSECLFQGLDCLLHSHTLTNGEFFPAWLRVIGTIIAIYGGLALLAGAVWAVVQLVRQEKEAGGDAVSETVTDEGMPAESNILSNTVLGFKLLWRKKDFWKRDLQAQRSYSNIIVLGGAVLAALSLTMNSVEGSSTHVLLFLLAGIAVYGGFLANKEIMETNPRDQLRESLDAAGIMRGAPGATLAPEVEAVTAEAPVAEAPPEPEATEAAAPEEAPAAEEPEAEEPEEAAPEEPTPEAVDTFEAIEERTSRWRGAQEEQPSATVEPAPEPEESAPSQVEEQSPEPSPFPLDGGRLGWG